MLLELDVAPLIVRLLVAAAFLLATTACDRQSQETPQAPAPRAELMGALDIRRRGEAIPDAVFQDPSGRPVTLARFAGTPVLVNLWATWCAPCVAEMPTLDALAARSAGRLQVLTVSQDVTGAVVVTPFFERAQYQALQPWLDPEGNLGAAIGTERLPTTVLYDADGHEVWRIIGGLDWQGPRANTLLADVVEVPPGVPVNPGAAR